MPPKTLIDGYSYFVSEQSSKLGAKGGLYHKDTRYLSQLEISIADTTIGPIGETLEAPNARTVSLAPASPLANEIQDEHVPKHTDLVVTRNQSVHEGQGYAETITLQNYSKSARTVEIYIEFETDFADLFEVRGLQSDINRDITTSVDTQTVTKEYQYDSTTGDTVTQQSTIRFGVIPDSLNRHTATFSAEISPQEEFKIPLAVELNTASLEATAPTDRTPPIRMPRVETGSDAYNAVFDRAAADLEALTTDTEYGPVPLAGTPWFATPFGRDAILTAHQTLAVAPDLAEGTLRYFAAHQGTTDDPRREEEPGKVFHEIRHGELADRDLIPHTPYYGTVDATALWVMLLAATCRWDDTEIANDLADSLVEALEWLVRTSEATSDDPFLYYQTGTGTLTHRAWKDTADSIRFADGTVADGDLAVAEVQGYAAAALQQGATLLEELDTDIEMTATPEAYRTQGQAIEQAFNDEFWLPDQSFYGLAKDAEGQIVDAITSNIGHCLWTGTIPDSRADEVVEKLVDGPLSSGWGLRTMSPTDAGYSPVSYHAGGVWPHDTSLAALGLARYGYGEQAEQLARSVLDAAGYFEHSRLPELYCGFSSDQDPVVYPAACTPQAWAAGAPYAFLQAALQVKPSKEGVTVQRSSTLFDDTVARVFGSEHSHP